MVQASTGGISNVVARNNGRRESSDFLFFAVYSHHFKAHGRSGRDLNRGVGKMTRNCWPDCQVFEANFPAG